MLAVVQGSLASPNSGPIKQLESGFSSRGSAKKLRKQIRKTENLALTACLPNSVSRHRHVSLRFTGSRPRDEANTPVDSVSSPANGLCPPPSSVTLLFSVVCDVKRRAQREIRKSEGVRPLSHSEAGKEKQDGLHLEW